MVCFLGPGSSEDRVWSISCLQALFRAFGRDMHACVVICFCECVRVCVYEINSGGRDVLAKEMAGGMAGFRLWIHSIALLLLCLLSCLGFCFSIANGLSVWDWRNGLVDTSSHLSVWDWKENETGPVPSCRELSCSVLRLWGNPCVGPRRCCCGPSTASMPTSEVWGPKTFLDVGLGKLVSACHGPPLPVPLPWATKAAMVHGGCVGLEGPGISRYFVCKWIWDPATWNSIHWFWGPYKMINHFLLNWLSY